MYSLFANIAIRGYTLWQQQQAKREARKAYIRKTRIARHLAAEQLAITYNSIQSKSIEVASAYRRKEFELAVQTRQAEGAAVQGAAAIGAMGKRVELARNMAVRGGSERIMTSLEIDAKREQDALIARADMEERATVNRLINGMPDAPLDTTSLDIGNFALGVLQDFGDYQDTEAGLQTQITLPSSSSGRR